MTPSRARLKGETMQRLLATLLLVGLVLVLLVPAALAAEDPGAALKALADAENKHDVNAALALYADNAVVTAPGDNFQTQTYQGKDQIKKWESSAMDPSERVELGAVQVSGNTATAPFKLYDDSFKQMGLDPADGKVSIVVDKGKVVALSIAFSPAWMNRAKAAMG